MSMPFTAVEAKYLIKEHKTILNSFSGVETILNSYQKKIGQAVELLLAQGARNVLADIPIEEINRGKSGFRVKTLRKHGYCTIADIASVSVYTLASIHGIGRNSANSIRAVVDDIVSKARKSIKVKINADDRTEEASYLVLAVYQYQKCLAVAEVCRDLNHANQGGIDRALENLSKSASYWKWLFASKKKKQLAEEAYAYLSMLLFGEYGKNAKYQLQVLEAVGHAAYYEAWNDFNENSIKYFNIIENMFPGLLGNDDMIYGLPEDLAEEVQKEVLFLKGLMCQLRRYQEWGVKFILHQEKVLLGDEMGLGKTVQAIAAMVSLHNTGVTHFIVVCPASVITNWCREILKMSNLNMVKIYGPEKEDSLRKWFETGGVAVTTYETTSIFSFPESFHYGMLVVDEAHYIKNPEAKRTENVKKISRYANRLLFMTGTALENKVDEMISLVTILRPSIASAISGMEELSSAPQFRLAVAPVYYRRKREEVLTELPELIESKEWCSLNDSEETAYVHALMTGNYADIRRVSWNVVDMRKSSKAMRLMEIVREAEMERRKVLVFSFFLETIYAITELLAGKCLGPISGAVSPQRRQEIIDEFDRAPVGSVLVAQILSGGTGLNIQTASVVVICEPQLKPSIENQAISRAYRMGQTRNVLVYRLLCDDTVDEKITSMLENKQTIFNAFADQSVAAGESMELDERTLRNIIGEEIERINGCAKPLQEGDKCAEDSDKI